MPNTDTKKKIELEIIREDGKTLFSFKIDPKITEVYKKQATEIKSSTKWEGLKFYSVPEITNNEEYNSLLSDYQLFDNYGSGIVNGRFMNIAWLRTVQGEGVIKVPDTLSIAQLSVFIKNTTSFLKEYFENYFRDCKIKGVVNIEI